MRGADLRARLMMLPKDALADLLVELGERDAHVRERLLLLAPTSQAPTRERAALDVDEVEQAVRRAIEVEHFIDYRGASSYAMGVEEALALIDRVLASPDSPRALRLVEIAMELLPSSLNNVDDSGEINEALAHTGDLHLRACAAAKLARAELAVKLFKAELEDEWGFIGDARRRYADLLGDEGRAAFDRHVAAAWEALPMLGPNERPPSSDARGARLKSMMEKVVGDDLEAQIELLKKDLSSPSAFERIARRCIEERQLERAITWIEKALRLFARREPKLVSLARELYAQTGRQDDLVQLAFDDFVEQLDAWSFARLKETCAPDAWPRWRATAIRHVEQQLEQSLKARTKNRWPKFADGTLLVEMLLLESDARGATEAARKFGCSNAAKARLDSS